MKTRLYINLTNKCNTNCPFCCMYSGTDKNRFITFDKFKEIIDNTEDEFELQLEGGEPLLHKQIFLFMEYAVSTSRCLKVIILTNGMELEGELKGFIEFAQRHNILVEFKISINYWLIQEWEKTHTEKFIAHLSKIAFSVEYMENINIIFNVRKRIEDEWLDEEIAKYDLTKQSHIFYFQSYGKLKGAKQYDGPVIVQNIDNWVLYASDGTCFQNDLIARSEYENCQTKTIINYESSESLCKINIKRNI